MSRKKSYFLGILVALFLLMGSLGFVHTAKAAPGSPATLYCTASYNGSGWDVYINWSFVHTDEVLPWTLTPYNVGVQGNGDGTIMSVSEFGEANFTFYPTRSPQSYFLGMLYSAYTNEELTYVCTVASSGTPPTVTLSASPTSGIYPTFAGLSWSTANNPTSCTAGGDWSGSKATSGGSETVGYPSPGLHNYSLTCSNQFGSNTANASIDIAQPTTFVTLTANPNPVSYNDATTLSWTSQNTTDCTATEGPGFSTGGSLNGSDLSDLLTTSTVFTIFCDGVGGSVTDSQIVGVGPHCTSSAPASSTVSINAGTQYVYAYGVTNASSVSFPTWGDVNGQNDIVWYTGTNLGGGTWRATVDLTQHSVGSPEYGNINSHVYMSGSGFVNVWCGTANFTLTNASASAQLQVRKTGTSDWLKNVTVNPGDQVDYQWSSVGGSSYSSTYSAFPATTWCGNPPTGSWVANSSSGQSLSNTVLSCQAGYTITLQYSVNGGVATDSVTVAVNNISTPTGSLTITPPSPCTITSPAVTCNPTPNITWATTNASYAQILVSKNGAAYGLFNPGCAATNTSPGIDQIVGLTNNFPDSYDFKLYAAPDCSSSPGGSLTGTIILLWDPANGAVPSGWTCISCSAGDAFYGVFPRAASAYSSSTGGSDTHTHSLTYSTSSNDGALGSASDAGPQMTGSQSPHTHIWPSATSASASSLPQYKQLLFIKRTNPPTLPAGVIGLFDGSVPSGWTRYSALDGLYLRGGPDASTGGFATHANTASVTSNTSASSATTGEDFFTGTTGAASNHTHSVSSGLTSDNNTPPYVNMVFGKLNASGSAPAGLIAFFDAVPPSGWSTISGGTAYSQNLLKGSSAYGGVGGSGTHSHGGVKVFTSGSPSTAVANLAIGDGSYGVWIATNSHVHSVTYNVASASSYPLFRDVVLAKYSAFTLLDTKTLSAQMGMPPSPGDLSTSNKDIVAIRGVPVSYHPDDGVAEANVGNQAISEGEDVRFRIHIRNTGGGVISGDFIVTDTLTNLVPPAAGWSTSNVNITCNNIVCSGYVLSNVSYDAANKRVTFTVQSTGGTLNQGNFISIEYQAFVKGPTSTSATVFRFQNEASISYTDPVNGASVSNCGALSPCPLRTPLVLFFRSLSMPFLKEVQ